MAEKEFIIFCDESEKKGAYYSNFYGGVLVGGSQYMKASERLNAVKRQENLFGEVKWRKVTEQYLSKYETLVRAFLDEVRQGTLKVRIMFTQNAHEPKGLSQEQMDLAYFLLYYQFIKHGFGLAYLDNDKQDTNLRLYFDKLPDTAERCAQFKGHLHGLQATKHFAGSQIHIAESDIVEVRSHDHVLLQCLDVVLGSMAFRLNERHKAVRPGTHRRGRKTVAKEKLFKVISEEVRRIRPNFNIGITTGLRGNQASLWADAYRHWCFVSKGSRYNEDKTKSRKKKPPPHLH